MEFLTNPWVIIIVVLAVVIGNIAVLKYTANMKMTTSEKKKSDLGKLNDLNKETPDKDK